MSTCEVAMETSVAGVEKNGSLMDTSDACQAKTVQENNGSAEVRAEGTADGVPLVFEKPKKVQVGKKCQILPADFAKLRQKEKSSYSSLKNNSFYSLCAGADMLLPNKPRVRTLSDEEEEKSKEEEKEKEKDEKEDDDKEYNDDPGDKPPARKRSSKSKSSKSSSNYYCEDEHYCKVCDVYINSEQTYLSHLQGRKHQKKLTALGAFSATDYFPDEYNQASLQRAKLDEALPPFREQIHDVLPRVNNKLDKTENACIGLSHVTEIWRINPVADAIYVCNLCYTICQPTTIVSHVIGYKHRLNYMKIMVPAEYEEVKILPVKKSELTAILEGRAESLEERHGRGTIVVEQELLSELDGVRPTPAFSRLRLQANPAPLSLENIRLLPSETRLDILEELKFLKPMEINNDHQCERIQESIVRFRKHIMMYRGMHNADFNYEDNQWPQQQQQQLDPSDPNYIPPFPYGQQQQGIRSPRPLVKPMIQGSGPRMNQPMGYSRAPMRTPSSYGMQSSSYGMQSSSYGMQSSLHGMKSSSYGMQSSSYDRLRGQMTQGQPRQNIRGQMQPPSSMVQYPQVQDYPRYRSILF